LSLDLDVIRSATNYDARFGEADDDVSQWEILADGGEHIKKSDDPMVIPDRLAIKRSINFDSQPYDQIFFDEFFPCIKGHGKLLDEYFADIRAPFRKTVVNKS
jgi:hypothetical protein